MAEESNKNMEKFKAYAFAFSRINQALDKAFPLEAIAMEESIISDRLRAYCEANDQPTEDKQGRSYGFRKLINTSQNLSKDSCPELHKVFDLCGHRSHRCYYSVSESHFMPPLAILPHHRWHKTTSLCKS